MYVSIKKSGNFLYLELQEKKSRLYSVKTANAVIDGTVEVQLPVACFCCIEEMFYFTFERVCKIQFATGVSNQYPMLTLNVAELLFLKWQQSHWKDVEYSLKGLNQETDT